MVVAVRLQLAQKSELGKVTRKRQLFLVRILLLMQMCLQLK